MKNRRTLSSLVAFMAIGFGGTAVAQDAPAVSYTPKHMWEVGLHGGYAFNQGDYDIKPGYGAGIHVRRAFDHIFAIRVDAQYFKLNSDAPAPGFPYTFQKFDATSIGAGAQAVVTLNNFRFDKPVRKVNIYAFAGPGVGRLQLNGTNAAGQKQDYFQTPAGASANKTSFYADAGGGIAFRVSPRFNIGFEYKYIVPFGKTADLLDGYNNVETAGTTYRDIANYANIRLNFNLGNKETLAEPLYWVNPLNQVIDELTELKARPVFDLTDTDGDGVIDMLDQENDTQEGAPVDTRGIALDSDGDGVKDYEDGEPYSPPGMTVDSRGVAQVPKYLTQPEIEDLIARKLTDYANSEGGGSLDGWFLPIIHFGDDSYTIRAADYGHLKNVAEVLRKNPNLRVVVEGFTDKRASDEYNRILSYNRARSAKEYLTNRYGISPDRLIIMYEGENEALVPVNGSSFMNRRVEFRVAEAADAEMAQPEGRAGRGTYFSGSRDAGY